MARSRDISKVLSSNSTLATDAEVAATYQTKAAAGLTLITTQSFTGVTGIILPTNTFTSTYDNYKIVFQPNACTADVGIYMRLRKSGVDASTNYRYAQMGYRTNASVYNNSSASQTYLFFGEMEGTLSAGYYTWNIEVYKPYVSGATHILCNATHTDSSGNFVTTQTSGWHTTSDTYDAAYIWTSDTPTFTGTYSVYGYNK